MSAEDYDQGEVTETGQLKFDDPLKHSHLFRLGAVKEIREASKAVALEASSLPSANAAEGSRADRLLCHLLVSIVTSRNDRSRLSDLLSLESLCDSLLHDSSRVHSVFSVLDAIVCNDTPLILDPQKPPPPKERVVRCGSKGCADEISSAGEAAKSPALEGSTAMTQRISVVPVRKGISSSQLAEPHIRYTTSDSVTYGGVACSSVEGGERGRVVQLGFGGLSSKVIAKRPFSELARCYAMETLTALLSTLGGPALGGKSLGIPWTERVVGVLHLLSICGSSETFRARAVGCLHELEISFPGLLLPLLGPQWESGVCPASTSGATQLSMERHFAPIAVDGGVPVYLEDLLLHKETPADAVAPLLLLVAHHAIEMATEELSAVDASSETFRAETFDVLRQSQQVDVKAVQRCDLRLIYKMAATGVSMLPLLPAGRTSLEDDFSFFSHSSHSARSGYSSKSSDSPHLHGAGKEASGSSGEGLRDNEQRFTVSLRLTQERLQSGVATALPASLTRLARRVLGECLDVFSACGVWAKVAIASEAVFFSKMLCLPSVVGPEFVLPLLLVDNLPLFFVGLQAAELQASAAGVETQHSLLDYSAFNGRMHGQSPLCMLACQKVIDLCENNSAPVYAVSLAIRWALDFFAWNPAVVQCFLPFSWDAPAAREQKLHALALHLARQQQQFVLEHPSDAENGLLAELMMSAEGSREALSPFCQSRSQVAPSLTDCGSVSVEGERMGRAEDELANSIDMEEGCNARAEASGTLRGCGALVSLEVFRHYVSGRRGSWWSHGCVLRFLCRCLFMRVVSLNAMCIFLKDALRPHPQEMIPSVLAMLSHFAQFAESSYSDNQYSKPSIPSRQGNLRSALSRRTSQLIQNRIVAQTQREPVDQNMSDCSQHRDSAIVLYHDLLRLVGEFVATVEPAEEILDFGALLFRLASETSLHPEFVCVSLLRLMGACVASDPTPKLQRQTTPVSTSICTGKSTAGFLQQQRERRLGVLVIQVCRQLFATYLVCEAGVNSPPPLCVTEYLRTFFLKLFRICCSGGSVLDTGLRESLREMTALATQSGAGTLAKLKVSEGHDFCEGVLRHVEHQTNDTGTLILDEEAFFRPDEESQAGVYNVDSLKAYFSFLNSNKFFIHLPFRLKYTTKGDTSCSCSFLSGNATAPSIQCSTAPTEQPPEIFGVEISFSNSRAYSTISGVLVPCLVNPVGVGGRMLSPSEQNAFPFVYDVVVKLQPLEPLPCTVSVHARFTDGMGCTYEGALEHFDVNFRDLFLPLLDIHMSVVKEKLEEKLSPFFVLNDACDDREGISDEDFAFEQECCFWKPEKHPGMLLTAVPSQADETGNNSQLLDFTNSRYEVRGEKRPFSTSAEFVVSSDEFHDEYFGSFGEVDGYVEGNDENIYNEKSHVVCTKNVCIFLPPRHHLLFKFLIGERVCLIKAATDSFGLLGFVDEYIEELFT